MSDPRPMDDKDVFEDMVKEVCDIERERTGGVAHEEEHRKFHAEIGQKIDAKKAAAKPKYGLYDGLNQSQAQETTVAVTPKVRNLNRTQLLLRQRIRKLIQLPEYREKFNRVNPLASMGSLGLGPQREVDDYFRTIVESSNSVFGDWRTQVLIFDVDDPITLVMPGKSTGLEPPTS